MGGEAAVGAVVDKFYDFMMADPQVNHFFKNTDMAKQRCRQKQFITLVTGGPHNYEGADMKTAHCKLNILKSHFDITWKHLENALNHFKVKKVLIDELKAVFYSVEADIVRGQSQVTPMTKEIKNEQNKPTGCPFKAKVSLTPTVDEDENNPIKLSRDAYMKWQY